MFFSENKKIQKCEHELLDRLVYDFLNILRSKYSERYYRFQITKLKWKLIYFVLWKKRGCLTEQEKKRLFQDIEEIINSIYKYFSCKRKFILKNYFLNFIVLRQTGNYHFNFLILNHAYFWNIKFRFWSYWSWLFLFLFFAYFLSIFSFVS